MAGWKLRKDKASAETLEAADADAPTQPQSEAAAHSEAEPQSEPAEPLHFDTASLPSFGTASEAHFTDLDFDSDPEEAKHEEIKHEDSYSPLPDFTQHAQVFEMSPAAFEDAPIALGAPSPVFAMPPPDTAAPAAKAAPDEEANDFQKLLRTGRFEAGELAPPPEFGFSDNGVPSVSPFVLDAPPLPRPPGPPQLTVHFGRLSAAFPVTKDVTAIGRPDSALHYYPDVELETDDAVSRRHAEIVKRPDGYYIVDTGSTNGTLLNGESLLPHAEHLLAPGDRIRVGERTEIVFGMMYLTVAQNVVNLYTEPDASSALASQAVLGERVEKLDEKDGFCRVITEDKYTGWLDLRLTALIGDQSDLLSTAIATLFADVYTEPNAHSEIITKLTVGTRVVIARQPERENWTRLNLPDGSDGYVHQVSLSQSHSNSRRLELAQESGLRRTDVVSALGIVIAETAGRLIGTPYLWGGTTPFGIDCSGLTQLAYKLSGVQLLRDAHLQFGDKRFVPVEEGQSLETAILDAGDLVAFSRRGDKHPTHIGIALGDGRFLHARGGRGVRVDFCDTAEYLQAYLGAVRLSPDADFAIQSA